MNASEAIEAVELYGFTTMQTARGWIVYHDGEFAGEGETWIEALERATEFMEKSSRLPTAHFPPFGSVA